MLFLCHMAYKWLVRPVIRLCSWWDTEVAHLWALSVLEWIECHPRVLAWLERVSKVYDERLHQTCLGGMKGLVILAAGFTKDGRALRALCALFDGVIIGTVLPREQQGNPRPRIWWHRVGLRYLLRNRMGFPCEGVESVTNRLLDYERRFGSFPARIGVSIGAMADMSPENAIHDYLSVYVNLRRRVDHLIDFFEINISSPNTKWLRELGSLRYFEDFLTLLIERIQALDEDHGWQPKEILLKLSPDMEDEEVVNLTTVCRKLGIRHFSCTNTTTKRGNLPEKVSKEGGLSGWYLHPFALHMTRQIHELVPDAIIIGTGGVKSCHAARDFERAGASLFGVFTAFFDEFPLIARLINQWYLDDMIMMCSKNMSELRGGRRKR